MKKKSKSLVGYTRENWVLYFHLSDTGKWVYFPTIRMEKDRDRPVKVCITIEEV